MTKKASKALREELAQQLERNKVLLANMRKRGLTDTNTMVTIIVHDIVHGEKAIGDDDVKLATQYLKGN